jgi:hypothetical protein
VDEHDDRQVRFRGRRTVDVQREAVLGANRLLQAVSDVEAVVRAAGRRAEEASFLDAPVPDNARVAHAVPRPMGHRGVPAQLSDRWIGKGMPSQERVPVDRLSSRPRTNLRLVCRTTWSSPAGAHETALSEADATTMPTAMAAMRVRTVIPF